MIHQIPDVLTSEQLAKLRALIDESPFESGERTAGYRARRVKDNLQMAPDAEYLDAIQKLVFQALVSNLAFRAAAMPRKFVLPMVSRYKPGMAYGAHIDNAIMGQRMGGLERSDLSYTLFLTDPSEYDGGELTLWSPYGEQRIKMPPGSLFLYPSTMLHLVSPVTRGERIVIVGWIESIVRDESRREILFDLNRIKQYLIDNHPDLPEADIALKTYGNLMRKWADT
jgi:PKHD-type hydroxylase